jgi:hypothetical protein
MRQQKHHLPMAGFKYKVYSCAVLYCVAYRRQSFAGVLLVARHSSLAMSLIADPIRSRLLSLFLCILTRENPLHPVDCVCKVNRLHPFVCWALNLNTKSATVIANSRVFPFCGFGYLFASLPFKILTRLTVTDRRQILQRWRNDETAVQYPTRCGLGLPAGACPMYLCGAQIS